MISKGISSIFLFISNRGEIRVHAQSRGTAKRIRPCERGKPTVVVGLVMILGQVDEKLETQLRFRRDQVPDLFIGL